MKSVWSPIQFPRSIMYETCSLLLHYHGPSTGNRAMMTTQIPKKACGEISVWKNKKRCQHFPIVLICAPSGVRRLMQSANLATPDAINSHLHHFTPDQSQYFYSLPASLGVEKRSPRYSDLIIPPFSWVKSIIKHAPCVGRHLTAN